MTKEYVDLFLNSYIAGNFDKYGEDEKKYRLYNIISQIEKNDFVLEYFIEEISKLDINISSDFLNNISLSKKILCLKDKILDKQNIPQSLLKNVSLIIPNLIQLYNDNCTDKILDMLDEEYSREKKVWEKLNAINEKKDIDQLIWDSELDIFTFYMRYNKFLSSEIRKTLISYIQKSFESYNDPSLDLYNEAVEKIIKSMIISYPNIKQDKLLQILKLFDSNIIKFNIINDIFFKNIDIDNFDNQLFTINLNIEKKFQILFNEVLPNNFKAFEVFKCSLNSLYNCHFHDNNDLKNRDAQIKSDLFKILLESNDFKIKRFLNILYCGDSIVKNCKLGSVMPLQDNRLLIEYRNILNVLLLLTDSKIIFESENVYSDLTNIKNALDLNDNENISDNLLKKYIDINRLNIEMKSDSIAKNLLDYINQRIIATTNNNRKPFEFEAGDIIRGMGSDFLLDTLNNGIRAREFYLTNNPSTDYSPLAADFSEISQESIQNHSFQQIIESTYASLYEIWLVIKKENLDEAVSYKDKCDRKPLRNIRTGIGSINVRALIVKQLTEEIKKILSTLDFYIPVLDYYSGKNIFTFEEYMFIKNNVEENKNLYADDNIKKV